MFLSSGEVFAALTLISSGARVNPGPERTSHRTSQITIETSLAYLGVCSLFVSFCVCVGDGFYFIFTKQLLLGGNEFPVCLLQLKCCSHVYQDSLKSPGTKCCCCVNSKRLCCPGQTGCVLFVGLTVDIRPMFCKELRSHF